MENCSSEAVQSHPALKRFAASLTRSEEAQLVELLSKNWLLPVVIPSILGLKIALRERLGLIGRLATRYARQDQAVSAKELEAETFIDLDFLQSAVLGIDFFNETIKQPERRWALLFDELEIAPDVIRRRLLMALRSSDQRLVFKLSLFPYTHDLRIISREDAPSPGQDYLPIGLWYSHKEECYPFSSELLSSMLREHGCEYTHPEAIFGTADFDLGRKEQLELGSAYKPGSHNYHQFRLLAERDTSFRKYLEFNRISLKTMHEMKDDDRASYIRKITSIVTVRQAFRSEIDGKPIGGAEKILASTPAHCRCSRSQRATLAPLLECWSH